MGRKQRLVVDYIKNLPIGEKISVRGLAKQLDISDGTAYRGIKQAEDKGYVSTIERVGTIRIEQKATRHRELLTFREIARITGGEVVGGVNGLDKPLNNFIIGAMRAEAVSKYFAANTIIIVGNRENIQRLALENNVAVLLTGGFNPSASIIELANTKQLPVIQTTHDTFTVATMINRSLSDQEISHEIITVADIYTPLDQSVALQSGDTVADFRILANQTSLSRFPVVSNGRLIGVITAKDLMGYSEQTPIERIMTKDLVTVQKHMSVASVSHKMIWEDIEMIPVVADNQKLLGVVSRQDVMRALQSVQQQPQNINTLEDEITAYIEEFPITTERYSYDYRALVQPQMINSLGTISYGVLVELITYAANQKVLDATSLNNIVEQIDLNYFNLIQIGNEIQFSVEIFHLTRRSALVEVNVYIENSLAARAILTLQIIERN
ncbi:DRTGG domain-containing protein [Hutsoniella sourekii]|uniref:DRTGG domain-containing protein n=1 Tax=Hutsoniella sourekii TaxID=87650 RepID=UPI0004802D2C|nr:DRTGG domain-containing protein [Hutsoniella sourekii]